jgi:uncharacterized protein involved in response to NO
MKVLRGWVTIKMIRPVTVGNMAQRIDRNMTVKEVLDRYPETAKVFHKYNLLIVGKSCGPHEPMAFFAKAHGVDYQQFAQELEAAISERPGKIEAIEIDSSLIGDTIYQKFVKTALILSVTTGCLYGTIKLFQAGMGGSFDILSRRAIQMHGASQLVGWAGLYIMGFFYFILPRLKGTTLAGRKWANLSYYLVLAGLIIRAIFYYLDRSSTPVYPLIAGLLDTGASSLFLSVCLRTLKRSTEPKAIQDNFLLAGMVWFLVSGIVYSILNLQLYLGHFPSENPHHAGSLPPYLFSAWVHLFLMGFVFNFIFGISSRTVSSFLDTPPVRERIIRKFFWIFNLSLTGYIISALTEYRPIYFITLLLIAHFTWLFIGSLRIFEKHVGDLDDIHMDRSHGRFIRVGYGWLAISLGIALFQLLSEDPYTAHMLRGAANHGYAVGFVSMLMIGYSMKMIPVFTGNRIWSGRLTKLTFWLLNIGNGSRIGFEILSATRNPAIHQIVGLTGFLEVLALILFGINIWVTMRQEETYEVKPIEVFTGNETVYALTEQFPQIIPVLKEAGFEKITNPMLRKTLGRAITVKRACEEQKVDLNILKEKIETAMGKA